MLQLEMETYEMPDLTCEGIRNSCILSLWDTGIHQRDTWRKAALGTGQVAAFTEQLFGLVFLGATPCREHHRCSSEEVRREREQEVGDEQSRADQLEGGRQGASRLTVLV